MNTTNRIGLTDCLSVMRLDLERQAKTVKPWDADHFPGWVAACGEVLAQVPCELQRISWAWSLAQAVLRGIVGIPHDLMTGFLLRSARAASARKAVPQ